MAAPKRSKNPLDALKRLESLAARSPLESLVSTSSVDDDGCRCRIAVVDARSFDRTDLVVDADDCPGEGDVAAERACLRTVVDALTKRDADAVRTLSDGRERVYDGESAAVLLAAGRFVERVRYHDETLAERCLTDPIGAAREVTGRGGPSERIAAETGLALWAERAADTEHVLDPTTKLQIARELVFERVPEGRERDTWKTATGARVRLIEAAAGFHYHVVPPCSRLDDDEAATLARAKERLVAGAESGATPARAVRAVADDSTGVERLVAILDRHTRGNGALDHCFADNRVTDVVVSAPATENRVRVRIDGERAETNVRLTPRGTAALSSVLRRTSGRPFSRADPTLDAVLDTPGGRVRATAVTSPASDGTGFAFRTHEQRPFRLPDLVANGTLGSDEAALLSVAVERGAAVLVAGSRGAGKTTLLGALLSELPMSTRSVLVEDTPELPVAALRAAGRDVQTLRTDRTDDGPELGPREAVRTALRLGEGALVVGEVRGEEAASLYEAMRVGAAGSAVLGTVHGEGAAGVRDRVTDDLGVDDAAFEATDLVVTCAGNPRAVTDIEEVREGSAVSLTAEGASLVDSGAVAEGRSELLVSLSRPTETYADLSEAIAERSERIAREAANGPVERRPLEEGRAA